MAEKFSTVGLRDWNDALAAHFFNEANADRPIFLFTTEDLIAETAAKLGTEPSSFIKAVGLDSKNERELMANRELTAKRAVSLCGKGQWRNDQNRRPYPPYVAHLCFFSFADVAIEASHIVGYHPRVRHLLGLSHKTVRLDEFDDLADVVCADLERWSIVDKEGSLGVFRRRVFGGHRYVGVLRSQSLIGPREMEALPIAFAEAGLTPGLLPSDNRLAEAMAASATLRPRTKSILRNEHSAEMRQALLSVVCDELTAWDGRVPASAAGQGTLNGTLRLTLGFDLSGRTVKAGMRCTHASEFPLEPMALVGFPGATLSCEEFNAPWSTPLQSADKPFDAATLDWEKPLIASETETQWKFRYRPAAIKLFTHGLQHGLPGWIETDSIERGSSGVLAYRTPLATRVERWASDGTEGRVMENLEGMPFGWKAIKIEKLLNGTGIADLCPAMGSSEAPTLAVLGGLRMGRVAYFPFRPPAIRLRGGTGRESVFSGGTEVLGTDGVYLIPPDQIVAGATIGISARVGDEECASAAVRFLPVGDWKRPNPAFMVDALAQHSDAGSVSGAFVTSTIDLDRFRSAVQLPAGYCTLLGAVPGQVASWPEDGLPDWKPVWAIGSTTVARRGKPVLFIGTDPSTDTPNHANQGREFHRVKPWRAAIWRDRKKLAPPKPNTAAGALWKRYQEAAQ